LQLSNTTSYLGYKLISQIGIRLDRKKIETFQKRDMSATNGLSFITVYASGGE
jgi:hypothetical protein